MSLVWKPIRLILGLLLVLSLTTPVWAADNYFVLRGGLGWADETERASGNWTATMSHKDVYEIDLAYGRRVLPWLRLEAELGYAEYNLDEFKGRSGSLDITGTDTHLKGMLNVLADWRNDTPFTPFIGAGLGAVRSEVKTSGHYPSGGVHDLSDSKVVLGYQFMAGVSWAPAPAWELELMYRYFGMGDRDFSEGDNTPDVNLDGTRASFVSLGLRFNF